MNAFTLAHHLIRLALKKIVVCIGNADNSCMRNLSLEGFCLILHSTSESRRVRYIKDCQYWRTDFRELLLPIKKCHTDGIVYRTRRGILR